MPCRIDETWNYPHLTNKDAQAQRGQTMLSCGRGRSSKLLGLVPHPLHCVPSHQAFLLVLLPETSFPVIRPTSAR